MFNHRFVDGRQGNYFRLVLCPRRKLTDNISCIHCWPCRVRWGILGRMVSCNKHFVTVSKRGAFYERWSSADTKWFMSSIVETFYSGRKIRRRWMWGRPRFWYSLVQMFPITLANHPIFATLLRRVFHLHMKYVSDQIWTVRGYLVGSSSAIITC
jgi:hypothetical protein